MTPSASSGRLAVALGRCSRAVDRHATAVSLVLLAALAYVPALASAPGRMPADTKLYLYLDPGGLVERAASTFEPDQFAGWVPFQQITYLWPSGPWYLLFETLGIPDWVAHRLWIGTIMFLAGAGVLWACRMLGVSRLGALSGALVYQLSPFLLAYVSRTSLLLLPWASLGWIVALTVRATATSAARDLTTWRRRLTPWRDPALIALIVATVGSTNATTLAMIVPAPVLWIVHAAWQRQLPWRRAAAVTARIAVLCMAVSTWWMAMLYVQSRNGPAVLAYTETLEDVSRNATGTEVLRGLGYWLFYQRDPAGPTTSASLDYLVSLRGIAVSFAVVLVGLAGLAFTSWSQRRYAALCVAVGVVLAVGVHPVDEPSPLMSLFVGDDGSGLALALRSSTRAVPVFLLGLALGVGAAITAIPQRAPLPIVRGRRQAAARLLAALGVALLAVANLPSLWNRAFVDPAIDRDQDPPTAWTDAVDRLTTSDPTARVLQIPGAEFGAFRWGYTTDHPLVGLTDKPVVTRDLLPLGSAGAMDLLFAFDDRIQDGTVEAAALAPIARLLGSDVVWLSDDAAFDRFRTARPEPLDAALTGVGPDLLATGIAGVERFGDPVVNVAEVPMVDPTAIVEPTVGTPLSPVALLTVDDPVPVIRAKTESVVVSGSGDGLVDAAAAGLLSGHELVRYSASLTDADLAAALADANSLIVTDTNRDQARHWRGSQDVRGHTEPGGANRDVLDATNADQRLELFPADEATQTVALQVGPVTATASSYGEPFAYRPEDRAVFAIDGDPSTAWRVADHGDPVGERIRLKVREGATDDAITSLRIVQPTPPAGGRSIASIRVVVEGDAPIEVALDDSSLSTDGQTIEIPPLSPGGAVTIEITGIVPGQFPLAASLAGVGFSEIDLGLDPTTEIIRVPTDGLAALDTDTPLALVFTRWRTEPSDPWRADPERSMSRQFELPGPRTFDQAVTLRLDRRATDDLLADLLAPASPVAIPTASSRITGGVAQWGAAAFDGDVSTAWVTPFDDAVGATLTFGSTAGLGPDLVIDQPAGPYSPITSVRLTNQSTGVDLDVPAPDAAGRSVVAIPPSFASSGPLELAIVAVEERTTVDRRYGDPRVLPAAIAEISGTEGIDPIVIDPSATVSVACSPDFLRIDGVDVPISFDTTVRELLAGSAIEATGCEPVDLAAGTHHLEAPVARPSALQVDRVVLADPALPPPAAASSAVAVEVTRNDPRARDVVVAPCPSGCWIVLGEGANAAWTASANGQSLGPGEVVDGGFNGWWLDPSEEPTEMEFRWTAQGPVTAALAVTLAAIIGCLALAFGAARGPRVRLAAPTPVRSMVPIPRRRAIVAAAVLVVAATALISPLWGAVALVPGAAAVLLAGRAAWTDRLFEATGLALAGAAALGVMAIERRDRPFPNAGWTDAFGRLNGLAVLAVLAVAVGAMFAIDARLTPADVPPDVPPDGPTDT